MKIFLVVFLCIHTISSLELKKLSSCQTALGMQSGSIPDSSITASSSYDSNSVGPKASRARTEQYGGAWCPSNQITSLPNEWLEIDFGNLTYLTQVETQGRFDNGRGKEFADYYILKYSRSNHLNNDNVEDDDIDDDDDSTSWIEYKPRIINNDDYNSSWIRANQNTYMGEIRQLNPPIIAKRLRFYPVSKQTRTICMRVEVYGCLFSDGIVSYSMPQGRTDINSLGDNTYDGEYIPKTNMLINGLGQLSDGITGSEDMSLVDGRQPWVGWSNDSNTHVTIIFQFDYPRQMNRVTIHTNNVFSKQISIFKTAVITFSLNGERTSYSNAIISDQNRDEIFEIARPILIQLNNHIAKYVRLDLYFDSKWLLISEITFDSQIYNEKFENKNQDLLVPINPLLTTYSDSMKMFTDIRKRNRDVLQTTTPITSINSLTTKSSSSTHFSNFITAELSLAFFIGASLAIGLLLIVSLVWLIRRKKKLQFQKLTEKPCNNSSCYTYPTLPIREFHDLNAPITSAIDEREYAVPDVNFYSTFTHSPHINLHKKPLPTLSTTSSYTCSPRLIRPTNVNCYPTLKPMPAHCCIHQQYLTMQHHHHHPPLPPPLPLPSSSSSIAYTQTEEFPILEASCGNNLMIKINSNVNHETININEINSENLNILEKIGDGLYGNIHLGEMKLSNNEKQNVIIKSLNENIDEKQKLLFSKEIELLSTINDNHLCTLLGILNNQRTVAIFEYYSFDLYQYLRQQTIPMDNCSASSFLLSLACQIASGMKYLSTNFIIHRDLSARNCLISTINHQIHITDIAMSKSLYANDYARIGRLQARIPLRWTSWESIFLNQYSLKSDIWSFGVTLYELYTYARERPYHALTNEQLVQQLASLSQGQLPISSFVYLPKPELCSKEIYDMMCECWQRDSIHRPSFSDIYTFLSGRSSGSAPLVTPEQL